MEGKITLQLFLVWSVLLTISCQLYDVQYIITEESAPRKFGNIVENSSLKSEFSSSDISTFTYRFLSQIDINIAINENNGDLNIIGRIDRDALCPKLAFCSREYEIIIASGSIRKTTKKINIVIEDINDNIPKFPKDSITFSIPESASVGLYFSLSFADDNDSPQYGIKNYFLSTWSDVFELRLINTSASVQSLRLVLLKALDRETKDSYQLKVNASDGSRDQGSLLIDIAVTDSNDHSPQFNSSAYEVSIKENVAVGTTIVTVYASDEDIGLNGQVVYNFQTTTRDKYGQLFGINNSTGAIYTLGPIDYEAASVYYLGVTAQDRGSDSLPVDSRVTVNVLDQNDNPPEITINTLVKSDTNEAEIPEDAVSGSFVAQLLVSDKDSGENGKITCTLNDNVFQLQETTPFARYEILTAASLDRERNPLYNLAIVCKDRGNPPQTSIKQLKVTILDVNDNKPAFKQPSYYAEVFENNTERVNVLTVSAVDADAGSNAMITYSLSEDIKKYFEIDPVSGSIWTKQPLDREKDNEVRFNVIGTDNGSKVRQSASALVVIKVKDINDEVPIFDEPEYTFHIVEESLPHSSVGIVFASDRDEAPGNRVTYSVDTVSSNIFNIDPDTGIIKTSVKLDREQMASYVIVITATDSGSPAKSSSIRVNIFLDDINDNKPIFVFPKGSNNTIQISNQHPVGQTIAIVHATDADQNSFGHVTYRLVDSVEAEDFSLNPLTGELNLIKDVSAINLREFNLVIAAQDQGTPPFEVFANLKVVVNKSVSLNGEPSAILSKPNETAVIALACVAALIIVPLAISIACICKHRNQNKYNKKQKFLQSLNFLAFNHSQKNQTKKQTRDPYSNTSPIPVLTSRDTEHMLQRDDKLPGFSRNSLQDSGIENPGHLSLSFQDEKDTSSAEGSNADSGRGASEADDITSNLHIVNTAPSGESNKLPKVSPIGSLYDSPGRRLLYTKTGDNTNFPGVHQHKQNCTRSHNINGNNYCPKKHNNSSHNIRPPTQRQTSNQYNDRHGPSYGDSDLQRSDSHPEKLNFRHEKCSSDVYV